MTALPWAEKFITFEKNSPISGPFTIRKYPMLRKPLGALDDPFIKQLVILKASSCLGTVFLQTASAYRLDRRPGDMLLVAQSDDDSAEWSKTRIRPFIERIEGLTSMLKAGKNAITNDLFQWPHQFALITGPGGTDRELEQCVAVFESLLLSVAQWTIRFGSDRILAKKNEPAAAPTASKITPNASQ